MGVADNNYYVILRFAMCQAIPECLHNKFFNNDTLSLEMGHGWNECHH